MDKTIKKIYVMVSNDIIDTINKDNLFPSREDLLFAIKKNVKEIYTYDLTPFCFDTLDQGYDVILLKDFKQIVLSELLLNNGKYTIKEIRKEHKVLRLFLAGTLNWDPII